MKKSLEELNIECIPQNQTFVLHLIIETYKKGEVNINDAYNWMLKEASRVRAKDRLDLLLSLHRKSVFGDDIKVRGMADTLFEQLFRAWYRK